MKTLKNIISSLLFTIAATSIFGCKKYIEETNLGGQTEDTYFVTKGGFEELVKSNYSNLRYIVSNINIFTLGTDTYTSLGTSDLSPLNIYNASLNSFIGDVDNFWKQLYYSIGTTNTTLFWATKAQGMDATTLNVRIGESKALRAYYYYLLVETFGDVPLVLARSTTANVSFTRMPEKDVYAQVISDLMEAIATLPTATTDFGRVTKGFAQHLLAKIYLTRGYKAYASSTDFAQAAALAEDLINSRIYTLKSPYLTLFDPTATNFQVNSEVIFSVQYSTNIATNHVYFLGKPMSNPVVGNNLQQNFLWDFTILTPIGRSPLYGKPLNVVPTPYFFSLFDKTRDSRYSATVWNTLMAQVPGTVSGRNFSVGDTVVYYPDATFTQAEKDKKKYFVFNANEYRSSPFSNSNRTFPLCKKFREVNLPFVDNGGARDTYVFRLGETYLMAAEANLKAGNTDKALKLYNVIRSRAAKPGANPKTGKSYATEMQASNLSIDDILDERARELAGEEFRWFELKRTGKLIIRTLAHNEEAATAHNLTEHFLLRPIPQSQIDLNSGASFPQNPGY